MSTLTASTRRTRSRFFIFSSHPPASCATGIPRTASGPLTTAVDCRSDQHVVFGAESALGFGVRYAPPLASVLRSSSLGGTYRVPPPPPFSQGVSHSSDSTGFWEVEWQLLLLEV